MNRTNTDFYFEIIDNDTVKVRGTKILNELSWTHELMTYPSLEVVLPIEYSEYVKGREEIKIHVNGKVFWGIIIDVDLNKADETMTLQIHHVVYEWTYRQISVNNAIKDGKLNVVFKGDYTVTNGDETITASDFSMSAERFNSSTAAELIEIAHAKAWNNKNGNPVKITEVTDIGKVTKTTTTTSSILSSSGTGKAVNISSKVKSYEKLIKKYCKKYHILPYMELVKAIMMQESGGSGGDPMQATEGPSNTKGGTITSPEYSIRCGIKDLKACLKAAGCTGPTDDAGLHLALQGYNYDIAYTKWAKKKYGKWTQANANEWQTEVLHGAGDNHYTQHVLRYYQYNPTSASQNKAIAKGEKIVEYAKTFLGVPYVWGGESRSGTDCSGFVYQVYHHFGLMNTRLSANGIWSSVGTQVKRSQAMPGDIICYGGHVAIYMGRGKRIHATPPKVQIAEGWGGSASYPYKGIKRVITNDNGSGWGNVSDTTSVTTQSSTEATEYDVTFHTAKGTKVTVKCTIQEDIPDEGTVSDASIIDNIGDIYHDYNFAYPGWDIDFQDDSADRMIDYVYSRQNKLEALTKTIELTPDLYWRVGFDNRKTIEIGKFGDKQPYILSLKPSGESNIRIVTEPTVDYSFEDVANVATVYSEKSDSGNSSMTLREVYNDPDLQIDGFPVVILRTNSNNERDYSKYVTQYPRLASNNELEFAVIDEESVALESGNLIETTFAFNDLAPFALDSKKISDKDRIKAAKTAYEASIRKLKDLRRSYTYPMTVEEIPAEINVGDKVRLLYDNDLWQMVECSNYYKKILSLDDWFYVQSVTYNIDRNGLEVDEVVLTKYIIIEREGGNDV